MVAQHKFGCRILERLLEHCPMESMANVVAEVISEAKKLSGHAFGNFVLQHILEHGTPQQRGSIIHSLHSVIPTLAQHKVGSHVVQRALDSSDESMQRVILTALAADEEQVLAVACSRYGSFVMEQIIDLPGDLGSHLRGVLERHMPELQEAQFG